MEALCSQLTYSTSSPAGYVNTRVHSVNSVTQAKCFLSSPNVCTGLHIQVKPRLLGIYTSTPSLFDYLKAGRQFGSRVCVMTRDIDASLALETARLL
ncbi:hypothetical protein G6O67_007512 [Ophiocordyceps sinensis]|uniref:Uncharacterized protein n=1 Tax=Ophiocordyceps sinensis TaxID=72228 RepID=A0A8H4LU14_9HYPO|nr:hypothetical protein G6O67_007512 [Ophiocordyceps sinensis]